MKLTGIIKRNSKRQAINKLVNFTPNNETFASTVHSNVDTSSGNLVTVKYENSALDTVRKIFV